MCYLSWLLTYNLNNDTFDLLSDDDLDNVDTADVSLVSVDDDNPNSINVDISNGFPFGNENFIVVHYNINSITATGRLENLNHFCNLLKIDVLILTESKLNKTIPTNLINIKGYHEPLRRDRTRHGGGVLMYISENLTFQHKQTL